MKTYLVFGAAGSVGQEVVRQLLAAGDRVIACVRRLPEDARDEPNLIHHPVEDVGNPWSVNWYARYLKKDFGDLDGVVYAVGHCPPGGSLDAVSRPLSQISPKRYLDEINMHQVGALKVFQGMLGGVKDGGCFVFLSSAITRFDTFPSAIQAHYHASVIAAQDWLVRGMRHDPNVISRNIKIHRIAPSAVDTPFHHGGPQPPKLLPVTFVAEEVFRALESEEVVDKQLL